MFKIIKSAYIGRWAWLVGLAILWLTPQPVAAGGVYYVSTTGNNANNGSASAPWRTMDYAIKQVPDNGSSIVVKEGVYNECVVINRRFSVVTVIKAETPYKVRWQCDASLPVFKIVAAKNITLEGFEITRPNMSGTQEWVIVVWNNSTTWVEKIVLRNNIIHDSVNNDLLRVGAGANNITVEGNMFYNQASLDEHIDVNGSYNVIIQDNVFFNDFAGSGRPNNRNTSSYIVIKDSDGTHGGSQHVRVRRNIFFNWQGIDKEFVLVGEDGNSTYEAVDVTIENNLMLGNGLDKMQAPIGVRGSKDVTVRANTIAGNQPSTYFVMAAYTVKNNLKNKNLQIHNNIWSDPTGTMGEDFSCCNGQTESYVFDNNLFFNNGQSFPGSYNPFVGVTNDIHRVIGDPKLGSQSGLTVPRWNGAGFNGGYTSIRAAFEGLVAKYGVLGVGSAAINRANPANMPADDIFGKSRSSADSTPDIGAYEARGFDMTIVPTFRAIAQGQQAVYTIQVEAVGAIDTVALQTNTPPEILYTLPTNVNVPGTAQLVLTSTHTTWPIPGEVFNVPIIATGGGFTHSTKVILLVGGSRIYLPIIFKN